MGILGNILGGKGEEKAPAKESGIPEQGAEGKYDEPCSLCGKGGTERKWAGKYWHVKCIRIAKKAAKGML